MIKVVRRIPLQESAIFQYADVVSESKCFVLIVCDEQCRDPALFKDVFDFRAQARPKIRIQA